MVTILAGCAGAEPDPPVEPEQIDQAPEPAPATTEAVMEEPEPEEADVPLQITSTAFQPGDPIPSRFSCDGEDFSPELNWSGVPEGTVSLTLIMDDPDAPGGTWVHWVLFDLPGDLRSLPESVAPDPNLGVGGAHGSNSWGRLGYGGPCPPGGTHRYFFKLYALDVLLDLEPAADKEAVLQALEGHVLAQAELMGTYARP